MSLMGGVPGPGQEGWWRQRLPHTTPSAPVCPQTTKAFLPRMLELRNGHIVCLNSVLALSAIPGAIDYCTSKASAFAFMESLTLGLLDCPGVSATTVLPFHTSTEMFQGMRVRSVGRAPASPPSQASCVCTGRARRRVPRSPTSAWRALGGCTCGRWGAQQGRVLVPAGGACTQHQG